MNTSFLVSIIQCNSGPNLTENLASLDKQLNSLSRTDLIILPEMAAHRRITRNDRMEQEIIPGPITSFFSAHAQRLQSWLIIGSLCETIPGSTKVYNTMVVLNPNGDVVTTYRKIHLFDCDIAGNSVNESASFEPGDTPQTVTINGFKLGLTICYDLRFPELFQDYSQRGVDMIIVPSSFTYETGKVHWKTLLKARAIETQSYIIAANQYGQGGGNGPTYGHSLIIDPWGMTLYEGPESEDAVVTLPLSKEKIQSVRTQLPILKHKRNHRGNHKHLYNFAIDPDNLR
jgi:predicted amidohydrolase